MGQRCLTRCCSCASAVSSGSVTVHADSTVQVLAEEAVTMDMLDLAVSGLCRAGAGSRAPSRGDFSPCVGGGCLRSFLWLWRARPEPGLRLHPLPCFPIAHSSASKGLLLVNSPQAVGRGSCAVITPCPGHFPPSHRC